MPSRTSATTEHKCCQVTLEVNFGRFTSSEIISGCIGKYRLESRRSDMIPSHHGNTSKPPCIAFPVRRGRKSKLKWKMPSGPGSDERQRPLSKVSRHKVFENLEQTLLLPSAPIATRSLRQTLVARASDAQMCLEVFTSFNPSPLVRQPRCIVRTGPQAFKAESIKMSSARLLPNLRAERPCCCLEILVDYDCNKL